MDGRYIEAALAAGFTEAGETGAEAAQGSEKIRAWCAPEKCGNYGKNWVCPPGCGSLEECRKTAAGYRKALVVMSRFDDVDTGDAAAMRDLAALHSRRTGIFLDRLRLDHPETYLLTTGGCDLCEACTWPDEPCRHPDKKRGSLSAFGIDVTKLCESAGVEYTFSPGTLRLISCLLYGKAGRR